METASKRSTATVPRPSHSLRYGDVNGTKTDTQPIGAYESDTVVKTWKPMKTTAKSDTRRWMSCSAKRGQRGVPNLTDVRTPRTTVPVRRTSATTPVARVVYHKR